MVDFTGTIDGVEFPGGQARDFAITLGEGRMLPEFEAARRRHARRARRETFPLTFPADYHGKEVAGKTAQFTLTVKRSSQPDVPPLDSAFADGVRHRSPDSVEDLRAEVESNLKLELKRKLESVLKDAGDERRCAKDAV